MCIKFSLISAKVKLKILSLALNVRFDANPALLLVFPYRRKQRWHMTGHLKKMESISRVCSALLFTALSCIVFAMDLF